MISSIARHLLSARGSLLRGSGALRSAVAATATPCASAAVFEPSAFARGFSADAAPASPGTGKVISSLVVERLPIILREDPPWEKEYREWQSTLASKYKAMPSELVEVDKREGDEDEDEPEDPWKPAPRTTPADESGDMKTTWRKLDRRLFLLVHNKKSKTWEFPSIDHRDGETIRATAERNMAAAVGDNVKCYFVGNAPCGHYPLPKGDGTLFFNKVQIMQKDISLAAGSGADDYAWVTSEEAQEYLKDKGLQELAKKMLSQ